MIYTPVFIGLGGLFVCLFGEGSKRFVLRASGKTAASLSFLAWALMLGVLDLQPHGLSIIIALILSLLGDVLLLSDKKSWFMAGIGAFLLAHVAYAYAFVQLGVSSVGMIAAAFVLVPGAWTVWGWLAPDVGSMAKPVIAYILVICAMVILAAGSAWHDVARVPMLIAAVLFFVSDLFVARQRFVAPTPNNRYIGLPLYYAAQYLFAWAATVA